MKELLRTNDPVLLSFVASLLDEGGIDHFVADRHVSSVLGSISIMGYPAQRVLVSDEDIERARRVLTDEGLSEHLRP